MVKVMKREDLVIGKYYVGYWDDNGRLREVIVKMNYYSLCNSNPYINAAGGFYYGECLSSNQVNFREATQEEIFWIDECIKQGKTIRKQDIDFSKMNNNLNYEIY